MIPFWMRRTVGYTVLHYKRRDLAQFRENLLQIKATQERRLVQILDMMRGSAFARDHHLERVRTPDDLKRALPVAPYERMAPYIERVKAGETTALFRPGTEVMMFAMTSGTTHAPKFIPVTRASLEDYRRSWAIWGCALAEAHPLVPFGGVINLASGYRAQSTTAGIPCGSISGLIVSVMHASLRLTNCLPPEVADVSDASLRQYLALRLALSRRDTMMVTTANPSTLISFARRLDRDQERLIRDLRDGTLQDRAHYPRAVMRKIGRRLRVKHVALAQELERLTRDGPLYPWRVWPHLAVAGVWTGGTLGAYLPDLPQYYGDVALWDHGLSASEGRMTIPLTGAMRGGVLNVTGPFFEFMPTTASDEDDPATYRAEELEVGGRYNLVVTTSGGLIRYDMQDIVECTAFVGATPVLRFLHKESQISSITGEKISAWQVTEAVRLASEELRWALTEFTVAPRYGDPAQYVLLLEESVWAAHPHRSHLARVVDEKMQSFNIEYRDKRLSGRLGPLAVVAVQEGTFARLMAARIAARGTPPEHYKHPFLIQDLDFVDRHACASSHLEKTSA